jgi:hypothetical protein
MCPEKRKIRFCIDSIRLHMKILYNKVIPFCWVPVAHTCNSSYTEAEFRRIAVQSQPRQIVHETISRENPSQKKGW